MSADNLSSIHLPPVAPTSDANPRRELPDKNSDKGKSQRKTKNKDQNKKNKTKVDEGKSSAADVEFERTEHELDDFA